MEEFLPSEIARAVYGYLLSEGCEEAARIFLDTSPNLTECKQRVRNGKRLTHANTLLLGRNLMEVLNIACSVHSLVKQSQEKRQQNQNDNVGDTSLHLLEQLRTFLLKESIENLSLEESTAQEQPPNSSKNVGQSQNLAEVNSGIETTPKKVQLLQTNSEQILSSPLNLDSLVSHEDKCQSQSSSQSQTHHTVDSRPSPHLNTPKRSNLQEGEVTIAENYKNLVQECSEGMDFSSSPDKLIPKNRNSDCRSTLNPPKSAQGTLFIPELEVENQSAIAAIAGITFRSSQTLAVNPPQTTPIYARPPTTTNLSLPSEPSLSSGGPHKCTLTNSNTQQVPSAHSLVISSSCNTASAVTQPIMSVATTSFLYTNPQPPMVSTASVVDGIHRLPDPPIIMLNSQYQPMMPLDPNDTSSSYFAGPPCAASTPRSAMFTPEDTACIIYPPISTNVQQKKTSERLKSKGVKQLRKLLPKQPRKDPPNIIHVNILPQTIDEEIECDADDEENLKTNLEDSKNERELAKELPAFEEDEHMENTKNKIEKELVLQKENTIDKYKKVTEENNRNEEKVIIEDGNDKEVDDKETPKSHVLKKNISRSTPRRNSHIRALSFNTPLKPTVRKANTSPKMPKIRFSPRTNKLNNVKRSALFKSPISTKSYRDLSRLTEDTENESQEDEEVTKANEKTMKKSSKVQPISRRATSKQKSPKQPCFNLETEEAEKENSGDFFEKLPLTKAPIATRSPAPKLSNAWKEVNDITLNDNPQWDEKIRSFICGDFVDPAPPSKLKAKRKTKGKPPCEKTFKNVSDEELKRRSSRLKKKNETSLGNNSTEINCVIVSEVTSQKVGSASTLTNLRKTNINKKKTMKTTPFTKKLCKMSPVHSVINKEECASIDDNVNNLTHVESSFNTSGFDKNLQIDSYEQKNQLLSKCSTGSDNEKLTSPEDNVVTNTNNILLEDLVVSSNSCFPQTVDDVGTEKDKLSKELASRLAANPLEKSSSVPDNHESLGSNEAIPITNCSLEITIPRCYTLETPLKECQIISQTGLNTPMLKTIRQDISVLEEDLLLTPSLPPTPQVNNFKHPDVTPSKIILNPNNSPSFSKDKSDDIKGNSYSQSKINNTKNTTNDIEVPIKSQCTSKGEKGSHPECINNDILDTLVNKSRANEVFSIKPDQENKVRTQTPSKEPTVPSDSTCTDSSEDEIHNNYIAQLKNNTKIRTRMVHGSKIDPPLNKINIYTSTESSDEEVVIKNNKKNNNISKLTSIILQNQRKQLDCKSKKSGSNKTHKKLPKNTSPGKASSSLLKKGSSRKIGKNTRKKNTPFIKSSFSEDDGEYHVVDNSLKNNTQKINSNPDKQVKSLTPEQARQQLQIDLLKRERQMIFGDGLSFSSDSDTESEVFERRAFTSKQVRSKKSEKSKRKTPQKEMSKIVSTIVSSKGDKKEKYEKCSIFDITQQKKFTLDNEMLRNEALPIIEKTAVIERNSEKIMQTLVEDCSNEVLKAVQSITSISPRHSSQRTTIKNAGNAANISISNDNNSPNKIDLRDTEHSKIQQYSADTVGTRDMSSITNANLSEEQNVNTDGRNIAANLNDSPFKTNCTPDKDIDKINEKKIISSEKNLPRAPTPFRVIPIKGDNVNNANSQPHFNESLEMEENHFVVVSNTSTKTKTSFGTFEFDPCMQCGFEVEDDKVITASFSEMMIHLALPSKNSTQKQTKNEFQKERLLEEVGISKYPTVKRRVKLTPVCDDKYEQKKLEIYCDIDIDGKVISKREKKQLNVDVLEFSCSTIDTNISLGESNKEECTAVEITNQKQQTKHTKMYGSDKKCDSNNSFTDKTRELQTKTINDDKRNKIDRSTYGRKYKHYIDKDPNEQYNYRSDSKENISRKSKTRTKEVVYRIEDNKMPRNNSLSSEDEQRKSRTYLDRRKERKPSYRRRDSSHRRTFEETESTKKYSRRSGDFDRRVYQERRYHTSSRRYRREESSSPESRRSFKQHSSNTSAGRIYSSKIPRDAPLAKTFNMHYDDVDSIDKIRNSSERDQNILNTVKMDPRAAEIISYSDLEKNESLSDEIAMDRKRPATVSSYSSPQVYQDTDKVESSLTRKRKVFDEQAELETVQAQKKLKLGEVEMNEAKSVLKHKMADMLNALHPDTSNEAT